MEKKLPADPLALVFGIISIVVGSTGSCCGGYLSLVTLGLSIAGLIIANKSLELYRHNPSEYSESSRNNVSVSRVINIISVSINVIILGLSILNLFFIGFSILDDLT